MERRSLPRKTINHRAIISDGDNSHPYNNRVLVRELTDEGVSILTENTLPDANLLQLVFDKYPNHSYSLKKIWGPSKFTEKNSLINPHLYGFSFCNLRRFQIRNLIQLLEKLNPVGERRLGQRRSQRRPINEANEKSQDRRASIPTYHCYINGKNIDTGSYSFYFKAESLLSQQDKIKTALSNIKKGVITDWSAENIFAICSIGGSEQNKLAIDSAFKATEHMQRLSLKTRIQILKDIRKNLIKEKEKFIFLLQYEGHPKKLAEWEFLGMVEGLRNETLEFYKTQMAQSKFQCKDNSIILVRRPDGIVCLVPPSNAASSNSLTACLSFLGGNVVIVKPPKTCPISTIFLWRDIILPAIKINGGPIGAVNIVIGNAQKIIEEWMIDPRVKDIIFFGTSEKGLEIGRKAYVNNKKPILELSGKDPFVVWEGADLEKAATCLTDAFLGSTQICMVPKIALVHEKIYAKFKNIFLKKVEQLKPGLPSSEKTLLSPVLKISEFYDYLEDALRNGGVKLCGGEQVNHEGLPSNKGNFINPSIIEIDDRNLQWLDMLCVKNENFFPLLPVIRISSVPGTDPNDSIFEKMVRFINENDFGLRVSIWVNSPKFTRRFTREITNSGLLLINQRHVGFNIILSTHGGTRKTGGPYGEMNYMWQRTTHLQGISICSQPWVFSRDTD